MLAREGTRPPDWALEFKHEVLEQTHNKPPQHMALNYGQFLVSPGIRNRAGEYHFLGDKEDKIFNRGTIVVLTKIIKNAMALAAEVV
eukprot:jgi/Psemu1/8668/gm1.8668_g